jgi:hypothetical protein
MKLLNDIISLLMDENGSLAGALLKTKVLLHDIGQRKLVGWVNSELAGYAEDAEVPPYRVVSMRVFGTVTNGYWRHTNRALMVYHLRDKFGDTFEVSRMRQAIDVLEKTVASSSPSGAMGKQLGFQVDRLLSKPFEDGYFVEGSYSHISIGQIQQILIDVRSRLLDFVLELRDEVGTGTSDEDVKERVNTLDIPGMFGKAVFGDNITIVVGNHNHQQVTNTLLKNDAAALAAELRKHGVSDDDIQTLNAALVEDPMPTTAGQYGPAVRGWMSRMLGKAVDGSWDVGVAVAGTLLASGVARYYGLPS